MTIDIFDGGRERAVRERDNTAAPEWDYCCLHRQEYLVVTGDLVVDCPAHRDEALKQAQIAAYVRHFHAYGSRMDCEERPLPKRSNRDEVRPGAFVERCLADLWARGGFGLVLFLIMLVMAIMGLWMQANNISLDALVRAWGVRL